MDLLTNRTGHSECLKSDGHCLAIYNANGSRRRGNPISRFRLR